MSPGFIVAGMFVRPLKPTEHDRFWDSFVAVIEALGLGFSGPSRNTGFEWYCAPLGRRRVVRESARRKVHAWLTAHKLVSYAVVTQIVDLDAVIDGYIPKGAAL